MAIQFLSNIRVNDEYTLPSADGAANQIITTDGAGQLSFVDQSTLNSGSAERTEILVKNLEGSALSKGDPVYIIGSVGASERLKVGLADAGVEAKMPCVGLLTQDLANNGEGTAIVTGKLKNLITSPIDGATPIENDTIYVKSGGGLTLTKPTGSTNLIQNVGQIGRVSTSSDGNIVVSAILRSNDVPNLPTGRIWVGDGNTIVSDTVYVDEPNNRVGLGTDSPDTLLHLAGNSPTIKLEDNVAGDYYNPKIEFFGFLEGGTLEYISNPSFTGMQLHFRNVSLNKDTFLRLTSGNATFSSNVTGGATLETDGVLKVTGSNDSYFSNGKVGIGTTSPDTALEVDGAISTTTSDYAQGSTGSRLLLETSGSGNTHSYIQAQSSGGTSNAEDLALQLYGGKVGIGTSSPYGKLDVAGDIRLQSDNQIYFGSTGSIPYWNVGVDNTTNNNFVIAGVSYYSGDRDILLNPVNNGNVGIGVTGPVSKLHVGDGDIRLDDGYEILWDNSGLITAGEELVLATGSTDSKIILDGADSGMRFITGNSTAIAIDDSQNVGIGTISTDFKLDVVGNSSIGSGNTLKSCTYTAQHSLVVGQSNTLGGIANGIIGVSNTIECTNEPWSLFGGNFIAGKNNTINNLYSHANAVFGQNNTVGDPTTSSNSVAGILVSGVLHSTFGNNSFAFGESCFTDINAERSLTGGYDCNNFGKFGSVAIGAGATASNGYNQYAFGTGVTTPTNSSYAYQADQFVVGKYNEYTNSSNVPHRFAVGNGTSDFSRDTPFCIIGGGTYTNGQVSINDSDGYAYTSVPYSIFHVNGRATSSYSSTFTTTSDERVKKNIVDYSKGLAEIIQVQPKSYAFNGKGNTIEDVESIGVLAQEINEVFPETVGTVNKKLNPEDEQETELYTVDISPVTYALINAVKELNAKVEALETRIQTLEGN